VSHRPKSNATRPRDLIQQRAGVEIPASGRWTIASGQSLSALRRGSFRTETVPLQTTQGALTVATGTKIVTLELGLLAPDAATPNPLTIGFEGGLSSADRFGRWVFDGTITVGGAATPFKLAFDYQGVHARGAAPVTWLTVADAFLPAGRGRRHRRRGLQIGGDLNAHRTPGGSSGVGTAAERAATIEETYVQDLAVVFRRHDSLAAPVSD